ncbi:ribonuclease E/G [Elioraea sp.]|uniref:ribonuclease E/G n=1 Tax=Elioraea sp. TaxID=2185103 RepID=UPI003F6FAAE2
MGRVERLLITCGPGERRLVGLAGDQVIAFGLERLGHPDRVGEVHRARVVSVVPGLAGAFVALADGVQAFLPAEEADPERLEGAAVRPIGTLLREGQAMMVRVVRAAMGSKGPRVTARVEPALREASPPRVAPSRLRTAPPLAAQWLMAGEAPARIVVDEADHALALRAAVPTVAERIAVHRGPAPLLDGAIETELAALAEPEVEVAPGVRLRIAITPALTAIDVDLSGGAGREAARRRRESANRTALAGIARQVVLRNLSGVIAIDLAGLPGGRGAREALRLAAEAVFAADPLAPRVLGFSRAGLLEVVRPRIRPPLAELLGTPVCAVVPSATTTALAALRALWREAEARPGRPPRLRAAPAVIDAARDETAALAFLAVRLGRAADLVPDPALAPHGWRVEDAGHG